MSNDPNQSPADKAAAAAAALAQAEAQLAAYKAQHGYSTGGPPSPQPTDYPAGSRPLGPALGADSKAVIPNTPTPESQRPDWRGEFARDPMRMSAAAIAAMEAELGAEQARTKRLSAVPEAAAYLGAHAVSVPGRGAIEAECESLESRIAMATREVGGYLRRGMDCAHPRVVEGLKHLRIMQSQLVALHAVDAVLDDLEAEHVEGIEPELAKRAQIARAAFDEHAAAGRERDDAARAYARQRTLAANTPKDAA